MQKVGNLNAGEFISLEEASSFLNVSKATLRNWDKKGKISVHRNPVNGYRTFDLNELRSIKNSLGFKQGLTK